MTRVNAADTAQLIRKSLALLYTSREVHRDVTGNVGCLPYFHDNGSNSLFFFCKTLKLILISDSMSGVVTSKEKKTLIKINDHS